MESQKYSMKAKEGAETSDTDVSRTQKGSKGRYSLREPTYYNKYKGKIVLGWKTKKQKMFKSNKKEVKGTGPYCGKPQPVNEVYRLSRSREGL